MVEVVADLVVEVTEDEGVHEEWVVEEGLVVPVVEDHQVGIEDVVEEIGKFVKYGWKNGTWSLAFCSLQIYLGNA